MEHGQEQVRTRRVRVAIGAAVFMGAGLAAAAERPGPRPADRREAAAIQQLSRLSQPDEADGLCGGEPCDAVIRGLLHFFDHTPEGLAGNGRSCGDCHMVTDHFQLSPANADRRFKLLEWRRRFDPSADDPLFRPIDADDFRINGDAASDFSNLRQNGLIRVTFDLPANIKLIDPATNVPSAETFVDIWRSVPTVNDVKITGPDGENPWPRDPNRSGGYQLDARVGTLQEQALGALLNHAQLPGPPSPQFLDDLHSFQRVLFTNNRVRALADAMDAGTTPLPDPDAPLSPLEQQGKVVFTRACAQCHGGPRQSTPAVPVIRYHDVAAGCPRPVDTVTPPRWSFAPCPPQLARNARTYEITQANGSKVRRTTDDPGRALLTGFVGLPQPQDDWSKFDMPALRGISKTAPYFHNNSAATLEDLVAHYVEFFKRVQANAPGGVPPPVATTDGIHFDRAPQPAELPALIAYLKKL
jgi:hypothetical protein